MGETKDAIDSTDLALSQRIPPELKEYKEIPEGYVPLYIVLNNESIDHVAKVGFRVLDNRSIERHGEEYENLFLDAGKKLKIKVNRTNCVFAYPRKPDQLRESFGFDEENQILVEVMVDPKSCLVAEASRFTDAGFALDHHDYKWAKVKADGYWKESMPLAEYLNEEHKGDLDDYEDFAFPEVLISEDIPIGRIRVVGDYKYNP